MIYKNLCMYIYIYMELCLYVKKNRETRMNGV